MLVLLLLLLLHHGKKEMEREIKEKEVGTQSPFDLFFFFLFQIDQHHREPFECKTRCMATACGAIFIHVFENTNMALYYLFLYIYI